MIGVKRVILILGVKIKKDCLGNRFSEAADNGPKISSSERLGKMATVG